jgi:hypothetical protein
MDRWRDIGGASSLVLLGTLLASPRLYGLTGRRLIRQAIHQHSAEFPTPHTQEVAK